MSYAPSTKLSHSDATARATVLTGDNVMVTRGLGAGQMMKLADWIILADGAKIQEEYIPVPKNEAAVPLPPTEIISPAEATARANLAHAGAMWAAAYAEQSAAAAPAAAPAAIGTKFRWTLSPETYRVAIMTSKGLLQVKSVTDGGGEVHPVTCRDCTPCRELAMTPPAPWARRPLTKTMFADEAAWRASLPAGGTVELSLPGKIASEPVYTGLSDLEKVKALVQRYKIRTQVYECSSQAEMMGRYYNNIQHLRQELAAITLQEDMNNPRARRRLDTALKRSMSVYQRVKAYCDQDPVKAAQKDLYVGRASTSKIRAMIGGEFKILTIYRDKIAAANELHRWGPVKLYSNFAEMGTPKLSVIYRRRTIDV